LRQAALKNNGKFDYDREIEGVRCSTATPIASG
jgi:hypothetical protein